MSVTAAALTVPSENPGEVMPSKSEALSVSNVRLSYEGNKEVLKGVSFSVESGEAVALLGHNGSGKSTLLRSVVGLEKISAGSISLLSSSFTAGKPARKLKSVRSQVGFIFQHHNLVPRLSVLSNVIHGAMAQSGSPRLWYQGFAPSQYREKALSILESVGLGAFAGRRADQLSGGQAQRVAIARALMQDPKIILADEPVASLDPQAGEDVMKLLTSLCSARGVTLVFASHHLEHCRDFAKRVIALKQGSLIIDKPCSEVDFQELRRIYE
jgi:phosphonate transport system ATP-binding protein